MFVIGEREREREGERERERERVCVCVRVRVCVCVCVCVYVCFHIILYINCFGSTVLYNLYKQNVVFRLICIILALRALMSAL